MYLLRERRPGEDSLVYALFRTLLPVEADVAGLERQQMGVKLLLLIPA